MGGFLVHPRNAWVGSNLLDRCSSLLRHELVLAFDEIRFRLFSLVALLLQKLLLHQVQRLFRVLVLGDVATLTAAEQYLVKSLPAEKGRDLLKQVRTHLIETARPVMAAMVEKITGVKVVTMHHDISTATGEEVVLFNLARSPMLRDAKKK